MVAFCGKKQFSVLFTPPLKRVEHGLQTMDMPSQWPFHRSTQVWVLPSSSGRAVMTKAEREGPYRELAEVLTALRSTSTDFVTSIDPDDVANDTDA